MYEKEITRVEAGGVLTRSVDETSCLFSRSLKTSMLLLAVFSFAFDAGFSPFNRRVLAQEKKPISSEELEKIPTNKKPHQLPTSGMTDAQATGIKQGDAKPGQKIDHDLDRPNVYGGRTESVREEKTGELLEERAFDGKGHLRELTEYGKDGREWKSEFDEGGNLTKGANVYPHGKTEFEYYPGGKRAGIKKVIEITYDDLTRQTQQVVIEKARPDASGSQRTKSITLEKKVYENDKDFTGKSRTGPGIRDPATGEYDFRPDAFAPESVPKKSGVPSSTRGSKPRTSRTPPTLVLPVRPISTVRSQTSPPRTATSLIAPCLMGKWQSVGITARSEIDAQSGGAGILLQIKDDGTETVVYPQVQLLYAKDAAGAFRTQVYAGSATIRITSFARHKYDVGGFEVNTETIKSDMKINVINTSPYGDKNETGFRNWESTLGHRPGAFEGTIKYKCTEDSLEFEPYSANAGSGWFSITYRRVGN